MADMQSSTAAPTIIRRSDYRPPDWLVPAIALDFDLDPALTIVRATLSVTRNGDHDRPLRLDGDGLVPLEVKVDGTALAADDWHMEAGSLIIALSGAALVDVSSGVECAPGEKDVNLIAAFLAARRTASKRSSSWPRKATAS